MLSQTISHYRILNHLGTSLIGEVYLAEDNHLGRKVALTLLSEQFTRVSERMERLARDARILSSLNHPNIRMIYEVGQDQSRHFIATEFAEGPTLRAYLSYTRMKPGEVLEVALQAVTGLAAAHAVGVLHRDLKPENIILRPDGYVKILDFGLAKLVERDAMLVNLAGSPIGPHTPTTEDLNAAMTELQSNDPVTDPYQTRPLDSGSEAESLDRVMSESGSPPLSRTEKDLWWMAGTPGYLSPEQMLGGTVDERSDIFSLGVVLYEMCTGRLPYEGVTMTSVINSISRGSPKPVRRFLPEAPEELDWIIDKALAKDPDERYQTAREWLNDLKRLKQRLEFESEQKSHGRRDSATGRGSNRRSTHSSRGGSEAVDSIAVIPIANVGNDPSSEYLSDGITESIINTLSRLTGLRVMARSTVFRYKGRKVDPKEVGRELGVRAVFIGRLIQRGEEIVIKAELVDAVDGALIWAEQYQRRSGNIFELEAEIAKQISEHLRIKLTGEQQAGLAKRYTDNPAAYDLYLKGRFFWNQRNPESIKKGIEYFVQAVKKDAGFALAYSGLADCYTVLSWFSVPPREFVPKARLSVTKALEIDEKLPEAHASLGFITLWYDWEFFKAEREFLRAIELNQNYPTAHHWYSYCLMAMERFNEARDRIQRALNLDPLSLVIITDIGEQLYRQRRYEEALTQYQKALEMDPEFELAKYWMLRAWLDTGKLTETIEMLEARPMEEGRHGTIALLALAHAKSGDHGAAQQVLGRLQQASSHVYVPPYHLAMIAANLGEKDRAFAWLDQAYQERSGWLPLLKQDPLADSLRTDARFIDLLRKVGLKP
jgi:eukaryotic-like serine/threonine-protein kinase